MFLGRWLNQLRLGSRSATRARRRARQQSQAARRLNLEHLEERALLSASVWTNKPDYTPGETAYITGQEFQPGEVVQLQVVHADGKPDIDDGHAPWQAVARPDGVL